MNEKVEEETRSSKTEQERPFIHFRHTCDGCLCTPIVGTRHHATTLPDYDLCSKCRDNYKGDEIQFEIVELDRDRPFQLRWHRKRERNSKRGGYSRRSQRCRGNGLRCSPELFGSDIKEAITVVDSDIKEAIRRSLDDVDVKQNDEPLDSKPDKSKNSVTETEETVKENLNSADDASVIVKSDPPEYSPAESESVAFSDTDNTAETEAESQISSPLPQNEDNPGKAQAFSGKKSEDLTAEDNTSEDDVADSITHNLDCPPAIEHVLDHSNDQMRTVIEKSNANEVVMKHKDRNILIDASIENASIKKSSNSITDDNIVIGVNNENEEAMKHEDSDIIIDASIENENVKKTSNSTTIVNVFNGSNNVNEGVMKHEDSNILIDASVENTSSKESSNDSVSSEDEWQVVADNKQPAKDVMIPKNDKMIAQAAQLLGSALFESDLLNSDNISGFDTGESVSLPSSLPSLSSAANSEISPVVLEKWSFHLFKLHELGFIDDNKSVDILEHLTAANIGVDSNEEVSVAQVVDALLKN